MATFNTLQGLDLEQVKKEIAFPVLREDVITEKDSILVNSNAVVREIDGEKQILGLIPRNRSLLPYDEIMDWVVDEFQQSGVDFKLKESSLLKRSNLFQQYVFDGEVLNPDGQDISPMVILKASHVGIPLKIDFGTYRFVCANGVVVGNTISSIKLRSNDLDNLLRFGLRDEIRAGLDNMKGVSQRYDELAGEDMDNIFVKMMASQRVPASLKKNVIQHMEAKGLVEIFAPGLIKGVNLLGAKENDLEFTSFDGEPIFKVLEKQSAWALYNDLTELATHTTKNEPARMYYYQTISNLFAA